MTGKTGGRQYRILEDCARHGGLWPERWIINALNRDSMDGLFKRDLLRRVVVQGVPRICITQEGRKKLSTKTSQRFPGDYPELG